MPIASYAALGDGRTVALVAEDGRIDWLPLPTLDAPPGFAAIVDPPSGGLRRADARRAGHRRAPVPARHQRPGDDVHAPTSGTVRVVDALAVGRSGRLPWSELIRQVEGVEGSVSLRWAVRPGSASRPCGPGRSRSAAPSLRARRRPEPGGPRPSTSGSRRSTATASTGRFATSPGSSRPARGVQQRRRTGLRLEPAATSRPHLAVTAGPVAGVVALGALRRPVVRRRPPLGAGAEAAASSPTPGRSPRRRRRPCPSGSAGDKNWDYRYMWVRDTSFTADAFLAPAHARGDPVGRELAARRHSAHRPGPAHLLQARRDAARRASRSLRAPGYRDSRPVRSGNGAADPDPARLLRRPLRHRAPLRRGRPPARPGHRPHARRPRRPLLRHLADRRMPASGSCTTDRHYTISKMGCWVALDRAVRLADDGGDRHRPRRPLGPRGRRVRAWVERALLVGDASRATPSTREPTTWTRRRCSPRAPASTAASGSPAPSARSAQELGRGPLLYRYTGMDAEEGCFLACTFWLVDALTELGRLDEARTLMDRGGRARQRRRTARRDDGSGRRRDAGQRSRRR